MIELDIKGWKHLHLSHLVLDVNGTLSLDGDLLSGVAEAIAELKPLVAVHLLSADTFGRLDNIAAELGVTATRLQPTMPEPEQKADYVCRVGRDAVAAIGNGANDVDMLREAALGIAVLGPEGLSRTALGAADVLTASIRDALGLLIYPRRLMASLRR